MDLTDLENRFTYHPPVSDVEAKIYEKIRGLALNFANELNEQCPDGREKALAMTHLEEVVFWANAAIARS